MKALPSYLTGLACGACLGVALATAGCGDGVITFGGDRNGGNNNDSVVVTGDIDDVQPPNAIRDVVVFTYVDLDPADLSDGPPFNTSGLSDAESVVVGADDTFSLPDIQGGALTIVFLRDEIVGDGSIDAGDTCAVLFDENNRLDNVNAGRKVDVQGIDIFFDPSSALCNPSNGELPAQGCGCALPRAIAINTTN